MPTSQTASETLGEDRGEVAQDKRPRRRRLAASTLERWAPWVLIAAESGALLFLIWHSEAPETGILGSLVLVVAATVASTLRLGERSYLGLGSIYLVGIAAESGAVVTALAMIVAHGLSERMTLFLESRLSEGLPERRVRARRLRDLLGVGVASGLAALALLAPWHEVVRLLVGASIFVATLWLHEVGSRQPQREDVRLPIGPLLDALLLLVGGFVFLGLEGEARLQGLRTLPRVAELGTGLIEVMGLLGLIALLSGMALATCILRLRTAHLAARLSVLDSIGSAPRRLGSPRRRQMDVVNSAVEEIRRLIDFDYLRLDLEGGSGGTWSARRGQPPSMTVIEPPRHPPPRPGIHRRRAWTVATRRLHSGNRDLGTLRLWCDPRRQDQRGLEVLDQLGEQVAALLERSMLAREARFDRLTGLPRRGVFDDELQRRWAAAKEAGEPMAVVLLDVDHFKAVNDTHGHLVGDQVLVFVANLLSGMQRDVDLCCRYGGEEFVLLVHRADGALALQLAERARESLQDSTFRTEDGLTELSLTLSAGAASVPELLLHTASDLVELADEALYVAKNDGRNRCYLAVGQGRFRGPSGRLVRTAGSTSESPEGTDGQRVVRL